jgi:hypothetical protein
LPRRNLSNSCAPAQAAGMLASPLRNPPPRLRQPLLRLHDDHRCFSSFGAFKAELPLLLKLGAERQAAASCVALLGLMEPLSGCHIQPREIAIDRSNLRESMAVAGCLARHRAITRVLAHQGETLASLRQKRLYLPETSTGFVHWLRRHGVAGLELSDFLHDAEIVPAGLRFHQNLCSLTYGDACFDLVICNDVFEHVYDLPKALAEVFRVLVVGGRLLATFPMAFAQRQNIIKAEYQGPQLPALFRAEPEYHGDPIRPTRGSLVYQIPGWDLLDLASAIGFSSVLIHLISSWKYGVLGADLPGVLVADFVR